MIVFFRKLQKFVYGARHRMYSSLDKLINNKGDIYYHNLKLIFVEVWVDFYEWKMYLDTSN